MIKYFNINTFNLSAGKLDALILIRLRWLMCALLALMAMMMAITELIASEQFVKVIFVLMAATLINNIFEDQYKKNGSAPVSNFWQLFLDLIITTIAFYFLGGIVNPTYFIMLLIPMIAPLFVNFKESIVLLLSCAQMLLLQIWSPYLQSDDFIPQAHDLIGIYIVLFASFSLMSWLSYLLEQTGLRLQNMVKQNIRVDGLKALGALSASFCHELGTPFATMRLCLDRIKEGRATQLDMELIRNSFSQCELSLQSMMSMGLDDKDIKLSKTSLNEILEKTTDNFLREDLNIKFTPAISETYVLLPKIPFTKMIVDIIENSFEADANEVIISLNKNEDHFIIEITDDGEGIDESVLIKLGTPFNTTKEQGTGIGLYNAKTLLEMLGGNLSIERRKGTTRGTVANLIISKSLEHKD
ncbi:sensor histidine kinase [Bacteriovorax sp. BSW11_IV]|uniref:sensor histidine kinase n=1 Tax=Bacteriovorax sp. BSW11_IV TaxID=1353529 RepID=UPI00069838C8|nr:HAMP domain-containing sensor histidine kinase [Bacteriovorax sp. BSW11_IV]